MFAQIINGFFDIFRRATKRNKNSFGVGGFIFGDQAVVAAGEVAELFVRID